VRFVALLLLVGCGRVGFDARLDGGAGDAPDGPMLLNDVAPLDAALPSGLVAWFPLDDTSATSVADVVSGFGGTCSGTQCPTTTTGHRGTGFLFDGTDDCIQVPDMGQFGQAKITLSIWIRQDAVDNCAPLSKPADSISTTADTWQIETTTASELTFTTSHASSANSRIATPINTIVVGTWQHIAVTFDGTTKRVYVNGTEVANGAKAEALAYDVQPVWIGCDNNSGTFGMRFNGALDEVQLYSRALTAAEIQMLAAL
jgi:hypothetical protein